MCRFGNGARNVEMKDRFRTSRSLLRQSTPTRISCSRCPISMQPIPDKVHIHVIHICRPVKTEVIKKGVPVPDYTVSLKVQPREREGMVYSDDGWNSIGKYHIEPLSQSATGPIRSRAWRWGRFRWYEFAGRNVRSQAPQARRRGLCTRIVDANVPAKKAQRTSPLNTPPSSNKRTAFLI